MALVPDARGLVNSPFRSHACHLDGQKGFVFFQNLAYAW